METAEQDGRTRSYAVTVSVLRNSAGVSEMWDFFELTVQGLHTLPDVLAPKMAERYGQLWEVSGARMWKRRLRVLRNSLSYHGGERGTCVLPSTLGGDPVLLRLNASRLP